MQPVRTYHRSALEAEGFTIYAIRSYIMQGVLPGAIGRGRNAHYTDIHLSILREIKKRREQKCLLRDVAEWRKQRYPGVV